MIDVSEMIAVILASCLGTGVIAVVGVVIFLKGELIRLSTLHEHQTQALQQNSADISGLKDQVAKIEKRTTLLEINPCLTAVKQTS